MSRFIPVEPEKWGEMVKALSEVTRLESENARLKEQVERLTKAGDAMADSIGGNSYWSHLDGLVAGWNAAKEGKQP